jgi:hypothetical protein
MDSIPTTIEEFAEACRDLDDDDIYELFEFKISPELRDQFYKIDPDSPEPVRAAMVSIGKKYGVPSLINY